MNSRSSSELATLIAALKAYKPPKLRLENWKYNYKNAKQELIELLEKQLKLLEAPANQRIISVLAVETESTGSDGNYSGATPYNPEPQQPLPHPPRLRLLTQ